MKKIGMRDRPAVRCGVCCASLIAVVGAMSGSSLAGDADCGWSERFTIAGVSMDPYSVAVSSTGDVLANGYISIAGDTRTRGTSRWDGVRWADASIEHPIGCEQLRRVLSLDVDGQRKVFGALRGVGEFCRDSVAAVWENGAWAHLGEPLGRYTDLEFCAHDEGQGTQVYVAGRLVIGSDVARWSDGAWQPVGELRSGFGEVLGLASMGSGAEARLFALGQFRSEYSQPYSALAEWDGTDWTLLDLPVTYQPVSIASIQQGPARGVYVSGEFVVEGQPTRLVKYDGSTFTPIPEPITFWTKLKSLTIDGEGRLFAFGNFSSVNGKAADDIAWWDGSEWHAVGPPGAGSRSEFVSDLDVWPGESGDRIVAVGNFGVRGGTRADNIAVLEGGEWKRFGELRDGIAGAVFQAQVVRDQAGESLYCMGYFNGAGQSPARNLARFDGNEWHAVPLPGEEPGGELAAIDTGGGEALHIAGPLSPPGEGGYRNLLRWDGVSTWTPVDLPSEEYLWNIEVTRRADAAEFFLAGMFDSMGMPELRVLDRRGGEWRNLNVPTLAEPNPHLRGAEWLGDGLDEGYFVVRGFELPDFRTVTRVHRWNGLEWRIAPVPEGWSTYDTVCVRSGPAKGVYLFGYFISYDSDIGVLRWNGEAFVPLEQLSGPRILWGGARGAALDFGDGEALYVWAGFSIMGQPDYYAAIAMWDGHAWRLIDEVTDWLPYELTKFQDRLVACSHVTGSPEVATGAVGMFGCIVRPCPTDITADGGTGMDDLVRVLGKWSQLAIGEPEDVDRDGVVTLADLAELIEHWDERCP